MSAPIITDECMNCGACVSECPVNAIYEGPGHYKIDPNLCTECMHCFFFCPVMAISYEVKS